MTADAPVTWLYAVVPGTTDDLPGDPTGVTGEPVRLVRAGKLAAAVGAMDTEQVGADRLAQRLQEPAWLERAVRRHHQVVTALFQHAPTMPFRLATVCHGEQRVAALLAEREIELLAALATVAGRAEWGVQGYLVPRPAAPGEPNPNQSTRPGTEYLLRRRAERSQQQQARVAALAAAQQVDAALAAIAIAVHRPPPTGHAADPEQSTPPVLNASFLVDDDRADRFQATVQELAGQLPQLRLRLTGPWPAYSFVEVAGAAA